MSFKLRVYTGPVVSFFVYRILTFTASGVPREGFEWGFYEQGEPKVQGSDGLDDIVKVGVDIATKFPTIFRTTNWSIDPMPPTQTIRPNPERCKEITETSPGAICGEGPAPLSSNNKSRLIQAISVCYDKMYGKFTISSIRVSDELIPDSTLELRLSGVSEVTGTSRASQPRSLNLNFGDGKVESSSKTSRRALSAKP